MMSIRAVYKNGVFKPLEAVPVKEGTEVDVYPRREERETAASAGSLSRKPLPTGSGLTALTLAAASIT
jgi:predicted DNA-binding antitoxin AbrB/MazE fold protein